MSSTRVMSEADLVPHRAAGYVWTKEGWKNQEWVSPTLNTTADGALYFDVLDLARWDAALYGERLLPRSRLERMWTVTKLRDGSPNSGRYGFGWFRDERDGHLVVEHEGEWQGFTAHIARYLEDRLTIAVLTNLGGADEVDRRRSGEDPPRGAVRPATAPSARGTGRSQQRTAPRRRQAARAGAARSDGRAGRRLRPAVKSGGAASG